MLSELIYVADLVILILYHVYVEPEALAVDSELEFVIVGTLCVVVAILLLNNSLQLCRFVKVKNIVKVAEICFYYEKRECRDDNEA